MASIESLGDSANLTDHINVVPVINPTSTNSAKWEAFIDDIKQNTSLHVAEPIESEKNPANTIDKLDSSVDDGDIVYIFGGDGSAGDIAQYAGLAASKNTILLFSPMGNACNAYHATISRPGFDGRPSTILNSGTIEPIFPLRARVDGDATYEKLALSVVSVGALATGAAVLDGPEQRASWFRQNPRTRLAYEYFLSICVAPYKLRMLEVSDEDGDNSRLNFDILAINAPLIAKRAKFDTEITEPDLLLADIRGRLPWSFADSLVRLHSGTLPVERIPRGESAADFRLTDSSRNDNAMIQFDGEARPLSLGSRVRFDQPGPDDPTYRPIAAITLR